MNGALSSLAPAAETVFAIAIVRLVPFALYAVLAHRRLDLSRLLSLMGVFAGCALVGRHLLPGLALGAVWTLSYFGLAACLAHAARRLVSSRKIGRIALFMGSFAVCLAGPAWFAPAQVKVGALVIGWEMMLSAFSYSVESAAQTATLNDALFFLLVNPVLVYSDRGVKVRGRKDVSRGLARIVLGLVAIGANYAMLLLLTALVVRGALSRETHFAEPADFARFIAYYGGQCMGLYFIHSGVASLQIGSMSILGWKIPERYEYPFLACSPAQFWRRWNIYVSSWVRRYLFFPAVTHLRRRARAYPTLTTAVAVLFAFGTMGFLHDCVPYLRGLPDKRAFLPAITAVFIGHGAALLFFEGAASRVRRFCTTRRIALESYVRYGGAGVSWLTLRLINASLAWVAIPVLSRGELPATIARVLGKLAP